MNGAEETQRLEGPPSLSQTCCLMDNGVRCSRSASNASYNKRIQKTVQQRRLKLVVDQGARHLFICDVHKTMIQRLRNQQKCRESRNVDHGELRPSHTEVNFSLLPFAFLRRYRSHFKLNTRSAASKVQMADLVAKHFLKQPVDEKEILTHFLYTCKNKNKQDNNESTS